MNHRLHKGMDGGYLEAWDSSLEINDSSGSIYLEKSIMSILLNERIGDILRFGTVSMPCLCGIGDCKTRFSVSDNGDVSITLDDGRVFGTKIDPRYCSRIYEAVSVANKTQADAYTLAESDYYYGYFQAEMLAEFKEMNEVAS